MEGPEGLDADRLVSELRQDGVLVESGSPFFPRSDQPCRYFRMGYSSIPGASIAEGVARVRARIDVLTCRNNSGKLNEHPAARGT